MADSLDCSIMSFAPDGTATLRRSMCLVWILSSVNTQASLVLRTLNRIVWTCFPGPPPLLLTDDWQTKIIKNNKRPGGLGPAVLAPLLPVLGPRPVDFHWESPEHRGPGRAIYNWLCFSHWKHSLTLLLTKPLNYWLCLLGQTTFYLSFLLFYFLSLPLRNDGWLDDPWQMLKQSHFSLGCSPIGW